MSYTTTGASTILLSPRPLARYPGHFLLLPLLPYRPSLKPLPSEIWSKILAYVYQHYDCELPGSLVQRDLLRQGLLLVCKDLKDVALPLFYEHVYINSLARLERFAENLRVSDQKWDSIRRIPYSTPGRWVQTLDLRELDIASPAEAYRLDNALNLLFPLLPFLIRFMVSPSIVLSRRAVGGIATRPETVHLRVLKGIRFESSSHVEPDHFVELLRACVGLEELSVIGTGVDMLDSSVSQEPLPFKPLHLPHLRKLVLLSLPCSPVMYALLHSPLPSLRHLTISPCDDTAVPCSLVPRFIHAHGAQLSSLHLFTAKTWPATSSPSPPTLLTSCPALHHLSLETPLPILMLPAFADAEPHPLCILSLPRPRPEFLAVLEALLPRLPALNTIRTRDVRWLRPGMSARAQQAGVQGEMVEWRRRFGRRGIQIVDSDWKTGLE